MTCPGRTPNSRVCFVCHEDITGQKVSHLGLLPAAVYANNRCIYDLERAESARTLKERRQSRSFDGYARIVGGSMCAMCHP